MKPLKPLKPAKPAPISSLPAPVPVLPPTLNPALPDVLTSLPALTPSQQKLITDSYMHALFILGEEAINAIRISMEACTEPKDAAKIAFGVLDRIGLGNRLASEGGGTGSGTGEKIAGAAIRAAIEGMAKITGVDVNAVRDALKSRPGTARIFEDVNIIEGNDEPADAEILESLKGSSS